MNDQLICAYIQRSINQFLDGHMGDTQTQTQTMKAHLRQCTICHSLFISTATGSIFQAQLNFRASLLDDDQLTDHIFLTPWPVDAFEPEPHYLAVYANTSVWQCAGNDYY